MSKFIPLVQACRTLHMRRIATSRLPRTLPSVSTPLFCRNASTITPVFGKDAARPAGSFYSPGVRAGGLVWVSGQVPADIDSQPIQGTTEEKAYRMCQNVRSILEAAGSSCENVVKANLIFANIGEDYKAVNKVYAEYFPHAPARTSIEAKLPLGWDFEMEVVALEKR